MDIFKSVKDFFKPSQQHKTEAGFTLPFNLTPGQYRAIQRLAMSEDFDAFQGALDALVKFHGETLLASNDDATIHYERGFIGGVRKVALLVDEIRRAESQHQIEKSRLENGRQPTSGQRITATFGSPAWRDKR